MWKLRVKIDAWSRGIDESIRQRNRLLLIEIYLRLPLGRVWFFVKHIRIAYLERENGLLKKSNVDDPVSRQGDDPEDTIAKGKPLLSIFT